MEKITFTADDGTKEEFYIEEQTRISGINYLLVSDSMQNEANACNFLPPTITHTENMK